jgi:hypothetical protein
VRVGEYARTLLPLFGAAIAMAIAIGAVKVMLAGHVGATEVLIAGLSAGMCIYVLTMWITDPGVLSHSRLYVQAMFAKRKCSESQVSA